MTKSSLSFNQIFYKCIHFLASENSSYTCKLRLPNLLNWPIKEHSKWKPRQKMQIITLSRLSHKKLFAVLFDLSVVLLRKLTSVFVQVENGREDFSK